LILRGNGLLQFGGETRGDIDPLVIRRFEVGQIAGDGVVPERGDVEHLLCSDVIGLIEQAVDHVSAIWKDV
jgi:hypothetical protein